MDELGDAIEAKKSRSYSPIEIRDSLTSPWPKIIIAIFLCLISAALRQCSDSYIPLQDVIVENMELTETQYNAISSSYSFITTFCLIFSSLIIDKIGYRICTSIFTASCFLGQVIFCLGIYCNIFPLLIVGRLIYGLGSESLQISLVKYAIFWFIGSHLTIVLSLQIALSAVINFISIFYTHRLFISLLNAYPNLHTLEVVSIIIAIPVALLFIAHILSYFLWICDKKYSYNHGVTNYEETNLPNGSFWCFKDFSYTYWILCLCCFVWTFPISSIFSISQMYYELKYGYPASTVNAILSLSQIAGICFTLFFGFVIGKTGIEIFWFILASLIGIVSHSLFSMTFITPYFIVVARTFAFSIVSTGFWPILKYVIPSSSISLGYGIILSIQNFGYAIGPFMIAYTLDSYGYFILEFTIQLYFAISFMCYVTAFLVDQKYTNGVLAMTTSNKVAFFSRSNIDLIDGIDDGDD